MQRGAFCLWLLDWLWTILVSSSLSLWGRCRSKGPCCDLHSPQDIQHSAPPGTRLLLLCSFSRTGESLHSTGSYCGSVHHPHHHQSPRSTPELQERTKLQQWFLPTWILSSQ